LKKLIKNWFIISGIVTILNSSVLSIFIIYAYFIKDHQLFFRLVFSLIGLLFASIIFLIVGTEFNKKIVDRIFRINCIVKEALPKDLSTRTLHSSEPSSDEIELLCSTIENVIFELKASECVKNDFISSMSHELRTPLTAIKGWAETMKTGDLIDFSTIKHGLEIIVKEASRLTGIVEELLDFSNLAGGRLAMNMEIIDILAEVGEAVYIFKERAVLEQKNLVYNDPKSVSYVYGDKAKLKQVFINIIDNALKYTNAGGAISVTVTERNRIITIETTDNGCGIQKSVLPNVTRKFFKACNSKRGFGIGLAVVKEIIHAHGGVIKIFSEENFGTTVIVNLKSV